MVKKVLGLVVSLSLLVGCANQFDVDMVKYQMIAEKEIAWAKSDLGVAQAEAISKTLNEESTDLERYLARQQIAGLVVTPSGIKNVTTGNDVISFLARDGSTIIKDVITGAVIWRGIIGLENVLADMGSTTIHAEEGAVVENTKITNKVVAGNDGTIKSTKEVEKVADEGVGSVEEGVDSGCTAEAPIMYNGTCYSQESVEERGFPVD